MNRRLTLKAEHLTELSPADLSGIAGGALGSIQGCLTGYYPSINAPCPTTDCFEVVTVQSVNSPCPTL